MTNTTFIRTSPNGRKYRFQCEAVILGIPVNPKLPPRFEDTPNEIRPDRQLALWGLPFIETSTRGAGRGKKGYDVRCLDGGAWDRSTWLGRSGNKQIAVIIAITKMAQGTPARWIEPTIFGGVR